MAGHRHLRLDERGRSYVEVIQKRTGTIIGSPEVAAHREGFIDSATLEALAQPLLKSGYGEYLLAAAREG